MFKRKIFVIELNSWQVFNASVLQKVWNNAGDFIYMPLSYVLSGRCGLFSLYQLCGIKFYSRPFSRDSLLQT